jgi:hypothetical protein
MDIVVVGLELHIGDIHDILIGQKTLRQVIINVLEHGHPFEVLGVKTNTEKGDQFITLNGRQIG